MKTNCLSAMIIESLSSLFIIASAWKLYIFRVIKNGPPNIIYYQIFQF